FGVKSTRWLLVADLQRRSLDVSITARRVCLELWAVTPHICAVNSNPDLRPSRLAREQSELTQQCRDVSVHPAPDDPSVLHLAHRTPRQINPTVRGGNRSEGALRAGQGKVSEVGPRHAPPGDNRVSLGEHLLGLQPQVGEGA